MGMRVGSSKLITEYVPPGNRAPQRFPDMEVPSITLTPTAKTELLKPQNWLSIDPIGGLAAALASEVSSRTGDSVFAPKQPKKKEKK